PTTIAGTPYTTACSPNKMTLPDAEPVHASELDTSRFSVFTSTLAGRESFRRPQEKVGSLFGEPRTLERAQGLFDELVHPPFDRFPRARALEQCDDILDLGVGRIATAQRFSDRVTVARPEAGERFVNEGRLFARANVAPEGFARLFGIAERAQQIVA